jgi:hypothetical protein
MISARSPADVASVNACLLLHLLEECFGLLVVLCGKTALQPEIELHQSLVCFSLYFIQLLGLAYVLSVEHDRTWRASYPVSVPTSPLLV